MTDKVEVYRLKLRRGISSSYPDWKLYESKAEFERNLLEALIEEGASYQNRSPFLDSCRAWLKHIFKEDNPYNAGVKVIGAEKLVDGQWISVKPRLVPPRLEYDCE